MNKNFGTTCQLIEKKTQIISDPNDIFETVLSLPEGIDRQGEGGLRTKDYWKKNYEDKPLISIVTVVYNGEKYLEETIQSVLNQTYDNIEYIIIDGCSTDGTIDIIKKYEEKIDYWVSERDRGIYDAMNKGILLASGEWINFMNAGDTIYTKNTLALIPFINIKKSKASIIYSDTYFFSNKSNSIRINNHKKLDLNHQSILYKRSLHQQYGNYVTGKKISISDYIFFNSIKDETFYKLDEILARYNIEGVSSDGDTFYRRICVDYLFGRKSFYNLLFSLMIYRPYKIIKNIIYKHQL